MASRRLTKAARDWHVAYSRYHQLKAENDRINQYTPFERRELLELDLELAISDLLQLRPPSIDAVCFKITLYAGDPSDRLIDSDDLSMLWDVLSDLRWLEQRMPVSCLGK